MTRRVARALAKKARYWCRKLGCCGMPAAPQIRRHGAQVAEEMWWEREEVRS